MALEKASVLVAGGAEGCARMTGELYRCGHRGRWEHGLHGHAVVAGACRSASLVETARPALAVLVDKYDDDDDGNEGEDGADSETHCLGMYFQKMET